MKIPYKFVERRVGDVAIAVANNEKALKILDWSPKKNIEEACADAWKWQKYNSTKI